MEYLLVIILVILIFVSKSNFSENKSLEKFYNTSRFNTFKGTKGNLTDCIYSIVMPDRKNYMISVLNNLGYNYVLFDAITPSDLTAGDYQTFCKNSHFITKKKTRLPLQLSFTMCYLNAIKNNYSNIIVFEDDIITNVDENTLNNSISEFKNSSYSMFYMGYCFLDCNQLFEETKSSLINVKNYSKLWCAHAIVYKVSILKKLIDYLYPMEHEFDVGLIKFIEKNNYRVCIPKEIYFKQDKNFKSNNETYNLDGSFTPDPSTCVINF
jgi:hypothetical protein